MPPDFRVGTDIIEITRIKQAFDKHGTRFLNRLFTSEEQTYCLRYRSSEKHLAGRFAAKEAIIKALPHTPPFALEWTDFEILNNRDGRPEVRLSKRLLAQFPSLHIDLSISHCHTFATATAISMYKTDVSLNIQ